MLLNRDGHAWRTGISLPREIPVNNFASCSVTRGGREEMLLGATGSAKTPAVKPEATASGKASPVASAPTLCREGFSGSRMRIILLSRDTSRIEHSTRLLQSKSFQCKAGSAQLQNERKMRRWYLYLVLEEMKLENCGSQKTVQRQCSLIKLV